MKKTPSKHVISEYHRLFNSVPGLSDLTDKYFNEMESLIIDTHGENTSTSELTYWAAKYITLDRYDHQRIPKNIEHTKTKHTNQLTSQEYGFIIRYLTKENIITIKMMLRFIGELGVMPHTVAPRKTSPYDPPKINDKFQDDKGNWIFPLYQKGNEYKQCIMTSEFHNDLIKFIDETKELRNGSEYLFISQQNYGGKPPTPFNYPTFWKTCDRDINPIIKKYRCVPKNKKITPKSFQGAANRNNGNINESHYERMV